MPCDLSSLPPPVRRTYPGSAWSSGRPAHPATMAASLGARAVTAVSGAARSLGKALDSMGASMEVAKYTERLVPSTRIVAVDGVAPTISETAAFIAPSANVVGNVTLGPNSSVWYGATLRGDVNSITVGTNSSIGDRAIVHVAKIQGDHPTAIGDNVTVGPGATVHAATIQDGVRIGPMAQIMDGATVGSNSIVAPGAVVTPGTSIPSGELWSGNPAKSVRKLTPEEIAEITDEAVSLAGLATIHADENAKDYKQLAQDEEDYDDKMQRDPEYWQRDTPDEEDVLGQGAPGRIFNTPLTNPEEGLKVKAAKKKAEE